MARCGVPRIDALLAGDSGASPLGPGDPDRAAVGVAQELLRMHGYDGLPDVRDESYGTFGPRTRAAVLDFRAATECGAGSCSVDKGLLDNLVATRSTAPSACRAYLTLALDFDFTAPLATVALTSLFESAGRFDCINRNTDRAGLSFGIIQWAQKPGRLRELLAAFDAEAPERFRSLAGGAAGAAGLLAHTAKPCGGVDAQTGRTTDRAYDLISSEWTDRFTAMGREAALQKIQVRCALAAFQKTAAAMRKSAPAIVSARGGAFMADLANQHGDAGAISIYRSACASAGDEARLLEAMETESVSRVAAQFGAGSSEAAAARARREFFRCTPLLADAA